MKFDALTSSALIAGAGAFAVEVMYLAHIRPFQADLGIQVSGALLVLWAGLVAAVFIVSGWRAWWVPVVTSPALIGPALLVGLFATCGAYNVCP